jgi:isopentenyl-diphosphate delta-isomerase
MIHERKLDHIAISLKSPVESRFSNGFDDITPVHRSLPEVSLDEINISTSFFGKPLSAPIVIAGMTGGHEKAKKINETLATVTQELGIAMGVGSQRAALENTDLVDTYRVARKAAPDAFLIANLGAVQFASDYSHDQAKEAVEMIEADALAIHLNPVQEAVQPEGDRDFKGCVNGISKLKKLKVPIIAKETGAGISREDASLLEKAGVSGIDVGGLGGTSFAAVESYREGVNRALAESFWDWGIPTAISTIEVLEATNLPVISTGGIRNGIDVAKTLALGSVAAGMALPILKSAMKGVGAAKATLNQIIEELKVAMFLMGAKDLKELLQTDVVITGRTKDWLSARDIDPKKYANRSGPNR